MTLRNSKTFFVVFLLYALAGFGVIMGASPIADAKASSWSEQKKQDFVNHMAQDAISIMHDQQHPFAARKKTLENTFSSVVDVDFIARFVVGKSWNNATDAQRERYVTLYCRYLIKSYISNYSEDPQKRIHDIKVNYIGETVNEKYNVRTQMQMANGQTIKVDYVVSDKDERYHVIDIIIEGVSLLSSHRNQFGDIALHKGMDAVIAKLEQLNGQPTYAAAE